MRAGGPAHRGIRLWLFPFPGKRGRGDGTGRDGGIAPEDEVGDFPGRGERVWGNALDFDPAIVASAPWTDLDTDGKPLPDVCNVLAVGPDQRTSESGGALEFNLQVAVVVGSKAVDQA